ncbi:MAG TPA: hypothetical protein ENI51_11355 [Candidatus Atribacteria bacterium]|nr:hypothetical protein [Candidatus Atribacteria bacterium]
MPLLRKIAKIGNARALVIPQQYLDYWKLKGKEVKQIGLDIVDDKLIVTPIFENKENHSTEEGGG